MDGGTEPSENTTSTPVNFPQEDMRFLVYGAAGGGHDAYARFMKPYLEEQLDTTITVENIPSGGARIGNRIWNAESDGHTIAIWSTQNAAATQVGLDVDYDVSAYSHVGAVTQSPNALVLMEDAGIETWDDFVNNVSELNFATNGQGAAGHIWMILLAALTDEFAVDDVNFVHYEGTGPALSGLERGESQAFLVGSSSSAVKVVQGIEGAKMFMVFSEPSVMEDYMGANDVSVQNWSSELDVNNMGRYADLTVFRRFLTAPPDVPDERLSILQDAHSAVIQNEDFRQDARDGARPIINAGGPEQVSSALESLLEEYNSEPIKGVLEETF
jgi:tripartite-type tricarboxylate transporter receptor subunit TctC